MSWKEICNQFLNKLTDDHFPRVRNAIFKEENNRMTVPENVQKIAKEFLEILEKYYPHIVKRTYDSHGYPNREGSPALERAEMCIYIELMKAGAFNDEI